MILGLGCGWHEPEYEAFGYPFDHRVGRFEEDLEVIGAAAAGRDGHVRGRWSRYDDAVLLPPPARRVPILVASKGERMLRPDGRWADAWNTAWFGAVDDRLRSRLAGLDAACAAVGRDPASIRRTVGIRLHEPGTAPATTRRAPTPTPLASPTCSTSSPASASTTRIIWSISKSAAALERIAEARRLHLGLADRAGPDSATMPR